MITRCVCYNLPFERILELSHESRITKLPKLLDKYNISKKCRRCNPYLREMLKTGETRFNGELKIRKSNG